MSSESSPKTFDLGRQRIGRIYAKALLDAAGEAGVVDLVLEEFESLLQDVVAVNPELREALTGQILSEEQRIAVLNKAFGDRMNQTLLTFLKVVTQHDRQDCLVEIYEATVKLNNEARGLVQVTATTATPMTEETAGSLASRLQQQLGKEIRLNPETDPEIIGGLVLQIGDTVIDGSVANRLKQVRRQALESTAQQAKNSLERFTNSSQS